MIFSILHLCCCIDNKVERSVSDFGQRVSRLPVTNDDDLPDIEPIFGSRNYRINGSEHSTVIIPKTDRFVTTRIRCYR